MKKRLLCQALCGILILWLLSGCAKAPEKSGADPLCGPAENEIYFYEKSDPKKVQLVIGMLESDDISAVVSGFAQKYPDVQPLICYLQKGTEEYSPAADWVRRGYAPDILYNFDLGRENKLYLEDLSGRTAVNAYYEEALAANDSGGTLYCLPGPAKVMGIAYNKTLFQQYGWTLPKTFDEFLTLCDQITKDTGGKVRPYNPNGKYATDFAGGLEAFSYRELFSGVENQKWYQDLLLGKAAFSDHMQPYFQIAREMAEHGALSAEDFNYSYTTRTKEFLAGRIAMINVFTDLDVKSGNGDTFAFTAFPGTRGQERYLSTRQCFGLSVVKKPRTKEREKAVGEYLDYISTPEAQVLCMGSGLMLSSVKGVPVPDVPGLSGLKQEISEGRYFRRIDFTGGAIPSDCNPLEQLRLGISGMIKDGKTPAEAVSALDASLSEALRNPPPGEKKAETVGTIRKDFTVLETSEYIADVFRQKTGADIALIPDNSAYRGNLHRMFSGPVTMSVLSAMTPRSLDNGSRLALTRMTGKNLLQALNHPLDYSGVGNCLYAFSGLKASAAPWNPIGEKYLSLTLENGDQIDPGKTYSVAFWQGMVDDRYVSETVQTWKETYPELLRESMAGKALAPSGDGRLKLVWEDAK